MANINEKVTESQPNRAVSVEFKAILDRVNFEPFKEAIKNVYCFCVKSVRREDAR